MRVLSLGAGVQSTALYRMFVKGELPYTVDYAIFADTQAEPPHVYETLESLERWGNIPIRVSTAGSLLDAVEKAAGGGRGRFASVPFWVEGSDGRPALGRRHCTREHKIDVVKREIRSLLGLKPGARAAGRYNVEQSIGISLDEAQRAKPSRDKWIKCRWPLLTDKPLRREEIKRWLESNGFPIPGRSACTFCPYRRPVEYATWRETSPDLFAEACRVDDLIRANGPLRGMKREQYIWRELKPLRELPPLEELEAKDESQPDLFGNECEGMCGV